MLDSSSFPRAIDNFKLVIDHFEEGEDPVILVGIKRPRLDSEEEINSESTLDRVHFLAHKNIAALYYQVSGCRNFGMD